MAIWNTQPVTPGARLQPNSSSSKLTLSVQDLAQASLHRHPSDLGEITPITTFNEEEWAASLDYVDLDSIGKIVGVLKVGSEELIALNDIIDTNNKHIGEIDRLKKEYHDYKDKNNTLLNLLKEMKEGLSSIQANRALIQQVTEIIDYAAKPVVAVTLVFTGIGTVPVFAAGGALLLTGAAKDTALKLPEISAEALEKEKKEDATSQQVKEDDSEQPRHQLESSYKKCEKLRDSYDLKDDAKKKAIKSLLDTLDLNDTKAAKYTKLCRLEKEKFEKLTEKNQDLENDIKLKKIGTTDFVLNITLSFFKKLSSIASPYIPSMPAFIKRKAETSPEGEPEAKKAKVGEKDPSIKA